MDKKTLNDYAKRFLGTDATYATVYDEVQEDLLTPMPRELGREDMNISSKQLGCDIWRCWEMTFLNRNGLPISGILVLTFPVSNSMMVESKSLKLYLNTFDQVKFSSVKDVVERIEDDLERVVGGVEVEFIEADRFLSFTGAYMGGICLDKGFSGLRHSDYLAKKNHLKEVSSNVRYCQQKFYTHSLRSRCRHTKQKDSGSILIFVKYKSSSRYILDQTSIIKQVVSLRDSTEFHELLCEKLYTDFLKMSCIEEVCVVMNYCRRGGIDINPVRASSLSYIKECLVYDDWDQWGHLKYIKSPIQ